MKLTISTYNGTSINDGTNYSAYFPEGSILMQPETNAVELERSNDYPIYSGQVIPTGHTVPLCIIMRGTIYSQIDDIRALISTTKKEAVVLVATDESSASWYINVKPISQPKIDGQMVTVLLSVSEPFWRKVTATEATWTITTTGSTVSVTSAGHLITKPTFDVKPTSAGGHGLGYSGFVIVRERKGKLFKLPLDITGASFDSASLLKVPSVSVTINDGDGITASDTTITYDGKAGSFPSTGIGMLEDEQISWTADSGTQLTGVTRGINGTTAATHANDIVIYKSLIQYSGSDVRVFVDGVDTDRWFGDWNTATTTVWVNISLNPKIEMSVNVAIADSGELTYIEFDHTTANKASLGRLPQQGMFLIDNEIFVYTAVSVSTYRVTGITRAAKGTAMAAHTTSDTAYFLEHDIWFAYGNQDMSDPETNNLYRPIFELDDSSNTSWHYHFYYDRARLRSGTWQPAVISTSNTIDPIYQTDFYTAYHYADEDPADYMGMAVLAYKSGDVWKSENGQVAWNFYHPAGIITVSATGYKYRYATSWASSCVLRKSTNGTTWANVWTSEATPASAQTWTSWTQNLISVGSGYFYLQFRLQSSIAAVANNANYYEVGDSTFVFNTDGVPYVAMATPAASYHLQPRITNTTTGQYIEFSYTMALDDTITINCENKSVTGPDGDRFDKILKTSTRRQNWLDLQPGANILQFDDAGTAGVTIGISFKDRNP